jgi:E3 ubiquitin-protein ligase RGLG
MKKFDDNIPQRSFDNFQFVNFTDICINPKIENKDVAFAISALIEIPLQYKYLKLNNIITKSKINNSQYIPGGVIEGM